MSYNNVKQTIKYQWTILRCSKLTERIEKCKIINSRMNARRRICNLEYLWNVLGICPDDVTLSDRTYVKELPEYGKIWHHCTYYSSHHFDTIDHRYHHHHFDTIDHRYHHHHFDTIDHRYHHHHFLTQCREWGRGRTSEPSDRSDRRGSSCNWRPRNASARSVCACSGSSGGSTNLPIGLSFESFGDECKYF